MTKAELNHLAIEKREEANWTIAYDETFDDLTWDMLYETQEEGVAASTLITYMTRYEEYGLAFLIFASCMRAMNEGISEKEASNKYLEEICFHYMAEN